MVKKPKNEKYYRINVKMLCFNEGSPNNFRLAIQSNLDDMYLHVKSHESLASSSFARNLFRVYNSKDYALDELLYEYDFLKQVKKEDKTISYSIPDYKVKIIINAKDEISESSSTCEAVFKGIHIRKCFTNEKGIIRVYLLFESIDSFIFKVDGEVIPLKEDMSPYIKVEENEDGSYKLIPFLGYHVGSSAGFEPLPEFYDTDIDKFYYYLIEDLNLVSGLI